MDKFRPTIRANSSSRFLLLARTPLLLISTSLIVFLLTSWANEGLCYEIQSLKIHISKGGIGWMEATAKTTQNIVDMADDSSPASKEINLNEAFNPFREYDFKNLNSKIEQTDDLPTSKNGIIKIVSYGEFNSIFAIVLVLDSSRPFLLRQRAPFTVQWDGNYFYLKMTQTVSQQNKTINMPESESRYFSIIITTDGRFEETCGGELNSAKNKLELQSKGLESLCFRIGEL